MFITLFLTMDAIGNISSYLKVLEHVDKRRYWWIVCREMLFALGFMLLFNFLGPFMIDAIGASEITVRLTSGLILLLFAISVIYPSEKNIRLQLEGIKDPFILPLAVPLTAGPALLATVSLFAMIEPSQICRLEAILWAWALSVVILLSGRFLQRILTNNGLLAMERLLALVLVMLATQRIMQGVKLFFTTYVT